MAPTYAVLTDVLVSRRQATNDERYTAAAQRYLEDATRDLTRAIGYSMLRRPDEGTASWIQNGDGSCVLHVHEGIAELETIEIRASVLDAWIELDMATWALEGNVGQSHDQQVAGEPAFHVVLLPGGAYTQFPRGRQTVRLTGARGWDPIADDARAATVAIVRQRLGLDQTGQGGQLGPQEFGSQGAPDRWPDQVWKYVYDEKLRHRGCAL